MTQRINIYDKAGQYLTEIDATFDCEWSLDGYGTAQMDISLKDVSQANNKYLQFGNLIYVEHDKLPEWAGVIDPPRAWGNGIVTVNCYSAEYMLKWRITELNQAFNGAYGEIFARLLESVYNDIVNTIVPGEVYDGGPSNKREYHYANIYDEIQKMASESGYDWDLTPEFDDTKRLYFNANWYKHKGVTRNFRLYEDKHIQLVGNFMREQGEIANRIRTFGDSSNWSSKLTAEADSIDSAAKYGVRYKAVNENGASKTQLQNSADQNLIDYSEPRRTFNLEIVNEGRAFNVIRVGDVLPISCHSIGFLGGGFGVATDVRVLKMKYNADKDTLTLTADEMPADEIREQ